MVIATVGRCKVSRIYVDTGSAVDVLYEHCFLQLPQDVQDRLKPPLYPVAGFTGETTWSLGRVSIDVTLEENKKRRTVALNFVVVRSQSKYNIIMGREALCKFGAIVSTVHGIMKFPTRLGVAIVFSDRVPVVGQVEQPLQPAALIEQGGSVIINHSFHEKTIQIGHTLTDATKSVLCQLLSNNADVFVWQESDMTGVPRTVAEHRLNANPSLTPVRKKKRGMAPERSAFLRSEVEKLVNGSWRMCVDFKDINKAYPKDNYPLPEIDWKVESLAGFRFKCFLDAYKGYHQIQMAERDEDKTAFHTDQGIFCYKKMPFGLKNAGAMYQRVIEAAFKAQIGRNVEAYVDDIVIKSHTETDLLKDIQETFDSL
ncbi:uncharacterized protein [Rutidosis leptorrhynchoides]|uniref:uncharacterized protein n=1 Tax=Rutidosis leptorrhynchoides TaxID=125765 RepID=UPI003A993A93